jgi:hypothetical protein
MGAYGFLMACVGERAQHAHAADRFAREIIAILAVIVVRSRRLMGRPLGRYHH